MKTEGAESMADVGLPDSLFANEVGDHGACRLEEGANVTKLSVLPTKMVAHFHVSSGRLVSRMEGHSNRSLVVAEKCGG